ncbi:hypothetical protein TNCV_199911 [Trichonephila clavipes]|nr:hypothetical protein TNCV_199911 [Trichonephila clavipes]
MPKEVEELVFVWASRLSPNPWVRFDYPFPFVIRSKNRGELQCLLKQWVDKCVPSLLCNLTLGVSRQTVRLAVTSAHAPQSPRWRILRWANDEAHFWLNGYVNKQNCRIWSEANPQVYAETPLHPEKLTVWCALWAVGILLQKR